MDQFIETDNNTTVNDIQRAARVLCFVETDRDAMAHMIGEGIDPMIAYLAVKAARIWMQGQTN